MANDFSIPEAVLRSISALCGLAEDEKARFLQAIKQVGPSFRSDDVAQLISGDLEIEIAKIEDYVEVLFTLAYVMHSSGQTREDVVRSTIRQLRSSPQIQDEYAFDEDELTRFGEFLDEALSADSVQVSTMALRMMLDQDKVLRSAELTSDVRPISLGDGTVPPTASVLFHTLKISYRENDENKSHYFALDLLDLKSLKESVDNALQRHKTLKTTFKRAGIQIIDPKGD
jgi:hypothetical protein